MPFLAHKKMCRFFLALVRSRVSHFRIAQSINQASGSVPVARFIANNAQNRHLHLSLFEWMLGAVVCRYFASPRRSIRWKSKTWRRGPSRERENASVERYTLNVHRRKSPVISWANFFDLTISLGTRAFQISAVGERSAPARSKKEGGNGKQSGAEEINTNKISECGLQSGVENFFPLVY